MKKPRRVMTERRLRAILRKAVVVLDTPPYLMVRIEKTKRARSQSAVRPTVVSH